MSNNVEEKILHGTTTVGIKATDGVVLCADMRASAGYFIANNNTMKIQKLNNMLSYISRRCSRCTKYCRCITLSCKFT